MFDDLVTKWPEILLVAGSVIKSAQYEKRVTEPVDSSIPFRVAGLGDAVITAGAHPR
jgi:hypothetical protein